MIERVEITDSPTRIPLPTSLTPSRIARRVDPWIAGVVVVLLGIGTVMIYSASAVRAYDAGGASGTFLLRHLIAVGLGLLAIAVVLRIPTQLWSRYAYLFLGLTFTALLACYIPGLGRRANGALRWLALGPIAFQPSELAKLATVVYLAHSLAKKREKIELFSVGFLPHVLVTSGLALLVLLQPDFGTTAIIFSTLGLMLFVAGTRIGYLILGLVLVSPVAYHYISTRPHAWARLLVFLNPEAYRSNIGYQIWESLISFGSGGALGAGLGEGRQKLHFLPEAHTDFIFAVIGEELGFFGAVLVLGLFAVLIFRGLRIAARSSCRFSMFLAFGLSAWLGVQVLTNMAVVIALIPTKGLTLPLVSFGGSSLVVTMIAIGLLMRVTAEETSLVEHGLERGRRA